jgi:hypothetical protein
MVLSRLAPRLYQNYLMPDRLPEYRAVLGDIRERGYRFLTMAAFADAAMNGGRPQHPVCVLRVDVDGDPGGAAQMFEIERTLGIQATYYFRLSTIDRALVTRMAEHGTEVGYHFEELSILARRRGLRTAADLEPARDALRAHFRANLELFRERTGVSPKTIAAHGDFLNRRLGLSNNWFLDRPMLDELRIVAEVYEPWLTAHISLRVADRAAPIWWRPCPPAEALKRKPAVLNLVLHPRQWVRAPWGNTRADLGRVATEVEYRFNRLRARR